MIGNILIREPITAEEFTALISEFPQYRLLNLDPDQPLLSLGLERCQAVEVMYGSKLKAEELRLLPRLHWIHSPTPYTDDLCVKEIRNQKNILISTTKSENLKQIGEFAISAALTFAKNLLGWEEGSCDPRNIDMERLRQSMWRIEERTFLQLGLGLVGTEITRRASQEGFNVIGAQEIPSFHPHCGTVYPLDQVEEILPTIDILSIAFPREQNVEPWLVKTRLEKMRDDSVIMGFGTGTVFDLEALEEVGKTGKFRGILLDSHFSPPITCEYALWSNPRVIVTHESSRFPLSKKDHGFYSFIHNLRQFVYGNYEDMKNLAKDLT